MTAGAAASLAEQRLLIRGQLRAQRDAVARQLAPAIELRGGYPRSATMRLLIRRPDLLPRLVALIAGAGFARAAPAIPVLIQMLRFAAAASARRRPVAAPTAIA